MFRTLQRKFDIRDNIAYVQIQTDKTLSVLTGNHDLQ